MRAAVYTRPNGRRHITPKRRDWEGPKLAPSSATAPLIVDKATECHITPPDVAARMVDYAGDLSGAVLEPSAGTGALLKAIAEAGRPLAGVTAVERYLPFYDALNPLGACCAMECFLEYAQRNKHARFNRVIMNPPFKKVRAHVKAARGLLAEGGRLVALVPCTFEGEGVEVLEDLPPGTFATAPGVRTKLIMQEART